MHERRRADIHQVNILPVQNVMMIQEHIRVQAVLFLDTLGFSGDNIHKSNDPAPVRKLKIRLDMRMGDPAGPDDGDPNHFAFPLYDKITTVTLCFLSLYPFQEAYPCRLK
jgi:hypothetical protein